MPGRRRATRNFLLIVMAFLACPYQARAGLYNLAEPEEGDIRKIRDFRSFRDTLLELQELANPKYQGNSVLWQRYQEKAKLPPGNLPASWTSLDKINQSAYYLRTGNNTQALEILRQLERLDGDYHFLVLCNLATAQYKDPRLRTDALDSQKKALRAWPKNWNAISQNQRQELEKAGWNEAYFEWFRLAETYYLKLLEYRLNPRLDLRQTTLDPLFDDGHIALIYAGLKIPRPARPVRFVGESGQFEVNKIAQVEKAKLPANALEIVQQLLIWWPGDPALSWLLGELYNAAGDHQAAQTLFSDLVPFSGPKVRSEEFKTRLKILLAYKETGNQTPKIQPLLKTDIAKSPTQNSKESPPTPPPPPPVDWRLALGVGFGTGAIAGVLIYWQIREIRRRRRLAKTEVGSGR